MTTQNYVLIGAGGTGTHLLRPLHAYLKAHHTAPDDDWMLHIYDGDVVEDKNLARQLFAPGHVTMNKADAATHSLGDEYHVAAHAEYVSEDNIERAIQNGDIVLICADNMTVRARIEQHAKTLDTITVINGGNELHSGSVQLWVRNLGMNQTPPIGFLHPEVAVAVGEDRAEMTCQQAAALPGGEQTIIANVQSATWMLTALWRCHDGLWMQGMEPGAANWTELQFDVQKGEVEHIDWRVAGGWST